MKKNNLDEAQEQKMLKIEHNAYGIAFWGLLIVIMIESALEPGNLKLLAGEWIVFITMCLYVTCSCIKNGLWDRHLKPNRKTNVAAGLIASVILAGYWFGVSYRNYHSFYGSLATAAVIFLSSFTMIYLALSFTTKLYKKRVKKLEAEMEE